MTEYHILIFGVVLIWVIFLLVGFLIHQHEVNTMQKDFEEFVTKRNINE